MYMLKMKIIFCMRGYLHSHLHVHVHCKESERACGLDRRKEKSAIIKYPTPDLRYNSPPPRFIHLPPPMLSQHACEVSEVLPHPIVLVALSQHACEVSEVHLIL